MVNIFSDLKVQFLCFDFKEIKALLWALAL